MFVTDFTLLLLWRRSARDSAASGIARSPWHGRCNPSSNDRSLYRHRAESASIVDASGKWKGSKLVGVRAIPFRVKALRPLLKKAANAADSTPAYSVPAKDRMQECLG